MLWDVFIHFVLPLVALVVGILLVSNLFKST